MKRTLLLCSLLAACGTEPGPLPAPPDSGSDAAVDAGQDAPPGMTPRCIGTPRLDCDGNGDCETPRNDPMNCGACGRACPAPRWCTSLGDCV